MFGLRALSNCRRPPVSRSEGRRAMRPTCLTLARKMQLAARTGLDLRVRTRCCLLLMIALGDLWSLHTCFHLALSPKCRARLFVFLLILFYASAACLSTSFDLLPAASLHLTSLRPLAA
ncbi:uncharacterized protein IWZ02DRAFT_1891 [Phyllosticta citriasiana]|uniref:uncharacterized protein n=1 Tax=Phyllosticta citriasiana TaxID=595635 RepID=UPI0030FDED94